MIGRPAVATNIQLKLVIDEKSKFVLAVGNVNVE